MFFHAKIYSSKRIAIFLSMISLFYPVCTFASDLDKILLPKEVAFPEGVAFDEGRGVLYTAGSFSGQIARIDPATGRVALVGNGMSSSIGDVNRGVLGLRVDPEGNLWMAGGRTGSIFVVNPDTGALLHVLKLPDGGLINDIAFVGKQAFVTDTLRPVIWTAKIDDGRVDAIEAWADLKGLRWTAKRQI